MFVGLASAGGALLIPKCVLHQLRMVASQEAHKLWKTSDLPLGQQFVHLFHEASSTSPTACPVGIGL